VWQPWQSGTYTYFMEWYEAGGRVHYLPTWLDKSPMEEPANQSLVLGVYRVVSDLPHWIAERRRPSVGVARLARRLTPGRQSPIR
jgi:hypothetical protein